MPLSDFTIKEELGKGAFGSVYLVKRNIDGQEYAMKRVKIIQLDEKEKENALNEIRILASLNHKNIIGYNEAFFDEITRTLNIVMEYADDGDLSKKIKYNLKNGLIFREDVIWDYLIQILEGINYLHENKIMHRDLKSANIFLMDDGTIKIGDLNVSKISEMGIAFTQIGTPYYASPEIWMDKSYDYKSDIWSIGCIIYELCMLLPPFRGTSIKNLSKNIQKGVYQPINNFYSDDLKKIVSMILVLNPEKRPSSSQLLKSDIVLRHIKKDYGSNKNFLNEEKAYLIKTIKMPKNLREINRKLPMKRYKKNQREEMLMNDEYETMKGFLKEKKERDIIKGFNNENEGRILHKNSHPQAHDVYNNKNHGLQNNNRQYAIFDIKNNKNEGNKKHKNIKKDNQVMIKGNQYEGYYPRTPNLATPNYNKYHNYNININIENNNKHNPRKGNIKKTRPKTGSNIINNNSMNKKNKVNKVNLNLNVNNNNKKPTRAVSSNPANRRAYIYNKNNMKHNPNSVNKSSIGNSNNKYNQRMNNINPYSNNYINVNRNYYQHNLNNDFNIINEKNIPYNKNQNNKKQKVIIEKMNYKPSKQNNNIYYNKHPLNKGKNDKKYEHEKERYKNNIYNYRDNIKKGNNK